MDGTPWRVVLHYIDDCRIVFNRSFRHLEPWQIVLYTISACIFVVWIRKILKFEEIMPWRKMYSNFLLNIKSYRNKRKEAKELCYKEIQERLMRFDRLKEFYRYLPDRGFLPDDIAKEARTYKSMSDFEPEKGRLSGAVFVGEGEDPIYMKTMKEIFPACRKMEAEIIRMLCSLFHGSSTQSCGTLAPSASDAIILACLAYRNRAFKSGIRKPEIIVGENADIAFTKAGKLLGLRIVRVQINQKYQVNVGAIKRAIGPETCLIVASAPTFVHGVMDNIEEISQLGIRFDIPVHVDANVGGFILPFMEQCDYPSPAFDFRLSGVMSISVDLHKYAYCPLGSSAILYRDSELLHHQCYSNINWSGGIFVSPTLSSSRSGLPIALTWATLLHNGREGFVEKTQKILDTSKRLEAKLRDEEIYPNIEVMGKPLGPIISFISTNDKLPIHALGDELNEYGWNLGFLQNPNALRLNISLCQAKENVIDEFLEDLNKCCQKIMENTAEIVYSQKTNVIYGISTSFQERGVSDYFPKAYVEAYYATPTIPHRTTRTLSIEGRKLSQINMPTGLLESFLKKREENKRTGNLLPVPQE